MLEGMSETNKQTAIITHNARSSDQFLGGSPAHLALVAVVLVLVLVLVLTVFVAVIGLLLSCCIGCCCSWVGRLAVVLLLRWCHSVLERLLETLGTSWFVVIGVVVAVVESAKLQQTVT